MLLNDFFQITAMQAQADGFRFSLRLNVGHPILAAHFPGHPVVPGVCQMQMVCECMQQALQCPLCLTGAKNVKYLAPLVPHDPCLLTLTVSRLVRTDQTLTCTALLADESTTYAKLSLQLGTHP